MGHTGHVWSLDWSPDSRWLVSGSEDYTARIWKTHPLSVRLAARDARRKMPLVIEPLVDQLHARLIPMVELASVLLIAQCALSRVVNAGDRGRFRGLAGRKWTASRRK